MQLSAQQTEAFDAIMAWHKTKEKRFVLSGYAGTGKTTLARKLEDELGAVMFLAYTGKAVNVLREKGISQFSTIHSLIYKPVKINGRLEFHLKDRSEIGDFKLVIVDEYSMLSNDLMKDLESVVGKILYLGDNFQLPPVKGTNALKPDFQLTEVHRHALESNIIRIASDIRQGILPTYCDHEDFYFNRKRSLDRSVFMNADQLLVGRNNTRREWIEKYRDYKELPEFEILKGEKIICLKNNRKLSIFNGMIGEIESNLKMEHGKFFDEISFDGKENIEIWTGDFTGLDPIKHKVDMMRDINRFDFGYAITVHKSQGSEFDTIVLNNEPIGRSNLDQWRWLYTGITRARKKVYLVD